jgi:hypothetical protein
LGAHVSWDIIVSLTASSDVSPAHCGTVAVTGRPSAPTRRIRSRRNHFETRFGSVEMMISSKRPVADGAPHRLERIRSADESLNRTSGGALQQRQSALQRPVSGVAVVPVRHQQRELTRSGSRALRHGLKKTMRRCRPVGDDQDPSGSRRFHRMPCSHRLQAIGDAYALRSSRASQADRRPRGTTIPLRLAVVIGASVSSDAVGMVPTGGELTLFEAVGRARA